ncbi:hypothetical protein MN608_01296 [Microdochium nivale]|nr:hypothetical protein MN608_01296 [Microdochium nivale]
MPLQASPAPVLLAPSLLVLSPESVAISPAVGCSAGLLGRLSACLAPAGSEFMLTSPLILSLLPPSSSLWSTTAVNKTQTVTAQNQARNAITTPDSTAVTPLDPRLDHEDLPMVGVVGSRSLPINQPTW